MKKLTWGLFTLLAGELLVISKKDKTFQKALKKKKWFDKVTYIFQTLLNFNKWIVEDTTKEIEDMNISWKVQESIDITKEHLENLYSTLEENVAHLEETINDLTKTWTKEASDQLARVKELYLEMKKTLKNTTNEMNEKYALEKKLVAIKKNIDTIRTSLKK